MQGAIQPPEMIPVQSRNVKAVGYRAAQSVLFVEFHGQSGRPDTLYKYSKFPADEYENLMSASSIGGYHYAFIRENPAYPCERIR